jgi:hypothetical protein
MKSDQAAASGKFHCEYGTICNRRRLVLINGRGSKPGFVTTGDIRMKITTVLAVALGVGALAACNNDTPQEQAADNIEANAEMTADNLEDAADNTASEATEDSLENQADATREAGEEAADATRDGMDADGNSAN